MARIPESVALKSSTCSWWWCHWAWLLRPGDAQMRALPDGKQINKSLSTPVRTAQPLCVEGDPFVQGETLEEKSVVHRKNLERRSRELAR